MNLQNLTKEQKLAILSKDFLDRDGESFVKARTEGRLHWEDSLEGGSYSEYILHPESNEDLLKNAYRIATDMITVMDTPYKVDINITGNTSATNSKTVFVATKVFDDPNLSIGKKLDTFIGLAVHEGCHLLYTDFNAASKESKLVHTLQNIIEDERIERECGESKPGLTNFLKAAKYYMFDMYSQELKANGALDNLDMFKRLLNVILATIRYPKTAEQADVEEFADVLLEVRDILTPYPNNYNEVLDAAKKIELLVKQYLKNNQPQQEQNHNNRQEQNNDSKEQNEGNSDGDTQSDNSEEQSESDSDSNGSEQTSGSNSEDSNSEEGKETKGGHGESNSSNPDSDSSSSSGNNESTESSGSEQDVDQQIEDDMQELESALKELASEQKQDLSYNEKSRTIDEENGLVGKVVSGEIERGKLKNSFIMKGTPNETVYKESLERVKPYISAVQKVLRVSSTEYKLSLKGMRSGVLDTSKLAEAFQGVPTVYERNGEVRTDKISVCMLIDESGSMWGTGEASARDTAVLLNEALTKIPNVDLYIYGHTGRRTSTSLYVYREKNDRQKYALGGTASRDGNNDSIAIREVANRVRKFTKDKVLFFMISDGAPNEPTDKVKEAVKDVERDGFSVVAISIDPYYDPSTMYSKNVTLSDMSSLAVEVGKLVKKAVLENTKKKVNI